MVKNLDSEVLKKEEDQSINYSEIDLNMVRYKAKIGNSKIKQLDTEEH